MSFLTVTPTGYPLAASGLQETPITQDLEISSVEITSQNENSNSNIFFIKGTAISEYFGTGIDMLPLLQCIMYNAL